MSVRRVPGYALQRGRQCVVGRPAGQKGVAHASYGQVTRYVPACFAAVRLHVASPSPDDAAIRFGPDIPQTADLAPARLNGSKAVHHELVQLVEVSLHIADRQYLYRPAELALVQVTVHGVHGFCQCHAPTADCPPLDLVLEGLDAG